MRRVHTVLALLGLFVGLVGLTACGNKTDHSADNSKPKVIIVTFDGNDVTPNGDRIDVAVDQPIELVVKADKPGEIHVHSTPEKELEYGSGTTTLAPFSIDKPGLITVESHALNKTIVQLEVK